MRWLLALSAAALACTAGSGPSGAPGHPDRPTSAATSATTSAPADVAARITEQMKRAAEAYKRGDYRAFLDACREAAKLSPQNPGIQYRVARGYALTGDAEAAIAVLERLAAMRLVYPISEHPDLASLRGMPAFDAVVARMERNRLHVGMSEVALTLPEDDLLVEGLAYDPATGRLFAGSVRHRKILVFEKDGARKDFVTEGRDGLLGVLGMRADPARRALWVCSAALPPTAGLTPEERGETAVFRYDLDTGALEKRYSLPEAAGEHALGDLTLTPEGDVFVSDSYSGEIYAIRRERDELELFLPAGALRSPQGLAADPGGALLYVADYAAGVFAVDRKTGAATPLAMPDDAPGFGIDGLVYDRGALLAIQNGVNPSRLVRLTLDTAGERVSRAEVVEMNHPSMQEPTLGVMTGAAFYYVGTSQWASFDENGALLPAEKRKPAVILKVVL
jgi:sugar lactone lactonase YvrE